MASGAAISSAGFTGGGVAAGSIAAGTQSAIGLVGAGSNFAYFQSLGALGQGIFGAYALPVVIGAVVIGGGAYVAYECFSEWLFVNMFLNYSILYIQIKYFGDYKFYTR